VFPSRSPRSARPRPSRMRLERAVLAVLLALGVTAAGGCGSKSTEPGGAQPTISSVEPDSGTVGTLVLITGVDFQSGLTVAFDDLPATNVTYVSATSALANAPEGLVKGQSYTVTVTNAGGKSADRAGGFKAVAPDLQVVNGVSKPSGSSGSTILFEGRAFGDILGYGAVHFSDGAGGDITAPVTLADNWTDQYVITTVPQNAATGPVWITTATGASDSIDFRLDTGATFSPSNIFWTETNTLPAAVQGHQAVFLTNDGAPGQDPVIYVTGGADGTVTPQNWVWRGTVEAGGAVSGWTSLGTLPAPRAFHGMALATPFNALIDTAQAAQIYVLGGIDTTGTVSTVWRAPVHIDRTLGAWTGELSLPEPIHAMGVAVVRSWLYVAGGADTANAAVSAVYRSRIGLDGSLGPWESLPSLPAPRAFGKMISFAGTLYYLGGDAGAVLPGSASVSGSQSSAIYRAPLHLRTGEFLNANWLVNPSTLIKAVAKHTALVAGGSVLVSGGVYNGAGSSATEHQYASFQLDGTLGSFGGATGSQTIQNAGGDPFYNHAAVSYVDNSGAAHVIILGGESINSPTTPIARTWIY
jgi:hypothetical protein